MNKELVKRLFVEMLRLAQHTLGIIEFLNSVKDKATEEEREIIDYYVTNATSSCVLSLSCFNLTCASYKEHAKNNDLVDKINNNETYNKMKKVINYTVDNNKFDDDIDVLSIIKLDDVYNLADICVIFSEIIDSDNCTPDDINEDILKKCFKNISTALHVYGTIVIGECKIIQNELIKVTKDIYGNNHRDFLLAVPFKEYSIFNMRLNAIKDDIYKCMNTKGGLNVNDIDAMVECGVITKTISSYIDDSIKSMLTSIRTIENIDIKEKERKASCVDKLVNDFYLLTIEYIHYENNEPTLITGLLAYNEEEDQTVYAAEFEQNSVGYNIFWNNLKAMSNMIVSRDLSDVVKQMHDLLSSNHKLESVLIEYIMKSVIDSLSVLKEVKGEKAVESAITESLDRIADRFSDALEVSANEKEIDKSKLN